MPQPPHQTRPVTGSGASSPIIRRAKMTSPPKRDELLPRQMTKKRRLSFPLLFLSVAVRFPIIRWGIMSAFGIRNAFLGSRYRLQGVLHADKLLLCPCRSQPQGAGCVSACNRLALLRHTFSHPLPPETCTALYIRYVHPWPWNGHR
ncbi:hypothetical protein GGI43DRAFT_158346 [Trichoderma evansii]